MNSQKLEIMEDMLTERLKFDWDKRTTTHLKEMLEEVKKEMKKEKIEKIDTSFQHNKPPISTVKVAEKLNEIIDLIN